VKPSIARCLLGAIAAAGASAGAALALDLGILLAALAYCGVGTVTLLGTALLAAAFEPAPRPVAQAQGRRIWA